MKEMTREDLIEVLAATLDEQDRENERHPEELKEARREARNDALDEAVKLTEARRVKVLNNKDDPSWTEHFAELQGEIRALGEKIAPTKGGKH